MSIKKNLDLILYDKIKDLLISGSYLPGQQLDIDEAAARYGVSRTPVVQAVKRLENEKILVAAGNGRIMVPTYTTKEIADICQARLLIESFAVDRICGIGGESSIGAMGKLEEEFEAYGTDDEYVQSCKADLAFHKTLVAGADNSQINDVYSVIQGRFLVVSYLSVSAKLRSRDRVIQDHHDLLKYLEAGNAREAKACLEEHIMSIHDQIVAFKEQGGSQK